MKQLTVKNTGDKPIPVGGMYVYPGESVVVFENAFKEAKQMNPEALVVSGEGEVPDGSSTDGTGKPTRKRRAGTKRNTQ